MSVFQNSIRRRKHEFAKTEREIEARIQEEEERERETRRLEEESESEEESQVEKETDSKQLKLTEGKCHFLFSLSTGDPNLITPPCKNDAGIFYSKSVILGIVTV